MERSKLPDGDELQKAIALSLQKRHKGEETTSSSLETSMMQHNISNASDLWDITSFLRKLSDTTSNIFSSLANKSSPKNSCLECSRIPHPDEDSKPKLKQLPVNLHKTLLRTIFGSQNVAACDVQSWYKQGLTFPDKATHSSTTPTWGLEQTSGGPCGVLASIQAYMLYWLLFDPNFLSTVMLPAEEQRLTGQKCPKCGTSDPDKFPQYPFKPSYADVDRSLALALTSILYQASTSDKFTLIFFNKMPDWIPPQPSVLEAAQNAGGEVYETSQIETLAEFILENLPLFQSPTGALSFVASVIATRGLEQVLDDMDDRECGLIATYAHSTQELVNLLLVGEAVSNVFDYNKGFAEMGGLILRGISKSPLVGYLTDMECMRLLEVGRNYKYPKVPIWVVCTKNHFSVVFSCDILVANPTDEEFLFTEAKKKFQEFDVDSTEIVAQDKISALFQKCQFGLTEEEAQKRVEISEGVLLWEEFLRLYTSLKIESLSKREKAPNEMIVHFYDGKRPPGPTVKSYDVAKCDVKPTEAQSDLTEASSLLGTRWPNCVVSSRSSMSI